MNDFLARLDQRPRWLRAARWAITVGLSLVASILILTALDRAFEPPSPRRVPSASGMNAQADVLRAHRAVLTWVAWRGALPQSIDELAAAGLLPVPPEDGETGAAISIQSTVERYRIDPPRRQ